MGKQVIFERLLPDFLILSDQVSRTSDSFVCQSHPAYSFARVRSLASSRWSDWLIIMNYISRIAEWTVYTLPNGAKYFFHSKARVVTDVDITDPSILRKVIRHLEEVTKDSQQHSPRDHKHVTFPEARPMDDTTPLPTASTQGRDWPGNMKGAPASAGLRYGYGATSSGFAYWRADAHTHEQGRMMGLEIWLKSLPASHDHAHTHANGHGHGHGSHESASVAMLWVDHISKVVSSESPWTKLGSIKAGDEGEESDAEGSCDSLTVYPR